MSNGAASMKTTRKELATMLRQLEGTIIPAFHAGGVPVSDMRNSLLDLYSMRRACRRPGSALRRWSDDIISQLETITL